MRNPFLDAKQLWIRGQYNDAYIYFNETLSQTEPIRLFSLDKDAAASFQSNDFESFLIHLLANRSYCNGSMTHIWKKIWAVAPFQFMITPLLVTDITNDPDEYFIEMGGTSNRKPLREDFIETVSWVSELIQQYEITSFEGARLYDGKAIIQHDLLSQATDDTTLELLEAHLSHVIDEQNTSAACNNWESLVFKNPRALCSRFFYLVQGGGTATKSTIADHFHNICETHPAFAKAATDAMLLMYQKSFPDSYYDSFVASETFRDRIQDGKKQLMDIAQALRSKNFTAFEQIISS